VRECDSEKEEEMGWGKEQVFDGMLQSSSSLNFQVEPRSQFSELQIQKFKVGVGVEERIGVKLSWVGPR